MSVFSDITSLTPSTSRNPQPSRLLGLGPMTLFHEGVNCPRDSFDQNVITLRGTLPSRQFHYRFFQINQNHSCQDFPTRECRTQRGRGPIIRNPSTPTDPRTPIKLRTYTSWAQGNEGISRFLKSLPIADNVLHVYGLKILLSYHRLIRNFFSRLRLSCNLVV